MVEDADLAFPGRAQRSFDLGGAGDGALDDLLDRHLGSGIPQRGPAVGDELVEVQHGILLRKTMALRRCSCPMHCWRAKLCRAFARVAARLRITQPALWRQGKAMEVPR